MMVDIESRVVSRLKNKLPSSLKTKYPNIRFTTSDRAPSEPKFPTVYVHLMSSPQLAKTLSGKSLGAIRASFQIEVTSPDSQDVTAEISNYVVDTMVSMNFEVVMIPENQNTTALFRSVSRYRRAIGSYDVL